MAVKKIIMKQKKNGTFDVLHPETEMSQIVDWQGGDGGLTKAVIEVKTEQHPLWVNFNVEYVTGPIVKCDKTILELREALLQRNVVVGIMSYPEDIKVEGYYYDYDGKFYLDSQHQEPITPSEDKIYIDLTAGQSLKKYRYNPGRYDEIITDSSMADYTGYYNPNDGRFYEDSAFTVEIVEEAYCIYKDIPSGKNYAYVAKSYIQISSAEEILLQYGYLQIPLVSAPGMNNVRFQILISDAELTINGRRLQNLEDYYDSWTLNYSEGIYQLSGSMSQVVTSKSNTYPSCAAVKAYVDEAIRNL